MLFSLYLSFMKLLWCYNSSSKVYFNPEEFKNHWRTFWKTVARFPFRYNSKFHKKIHFKSPSLYLFTHVVYHLNILSLSSFLSDCSAFFLQFPFSWPFLTSNTLPYPSSDPLLQLVCRVSFCTIFILYENHSVPLSFLSH